MMKTESGKGNMRTLAGEGVSPRLAKGKAFIYIDMLKRDSRLYKIDDAQIDDHPTILRLIEIVVEESGDTPVSLCGELAGRIDAMPSVLTYRCSGLISTRFDKLSTCSVWLIVLSLRACAHLLMPFAQGT